MPVRSSNTHDVLIAGAGPVGLMLASELRLAGASVLVLERDADPRSPAKELPFGLRGLSVPTVEALDRRELLDDVLAAQREREAAAGGGLATTAPHWKAQARAPAGHFAGIQFFRDDVDAARWPYRLPGPAAEPGTTAVALAALESVLAARALAAGAEIRRGRAVEAVRPTADAVSVDAGGESFRARWLVGCDGGRSAVRKLAGFAFRGTEPEFTGYSAAVELADPAMLRPGRHHTAGGMYTYAPPGTLAMADFDGGAAHRARPPTPEHVEAVLRRVSGTAVTVRSVRYAATWTDRAFQASEYRRGRVLLAGDAAHVHSPLGGQGLNLGLGDATNLGWKLGAAIRGKAPADLLDTYERERRPVGAAILDWSRAQVALMRPGPGTQALRAVFRDLAATGDGATHLAERVWGIELRHELGEGHPLVGRSAPDFALAGGGRVGAALRGGRGLLLDFEGNASLAALAAGCGGRIAYAAGDPRHRLGLAVALVRPDGIVAWASDAAPGEGDVGRAMERWFGEP